MKRLFLFIQTDFLRRQSVTTDRKRTAGTAERLLVDSHLEMLSGERRGVISGQTAIFQFCFFKSVPSFRASKHQV